jgi:hypothetical protein
MLRVIARLFGADPEHFSVILRTSLVMDLRAARGPARKSGNPFVGILVSYMGVGLIFAWILTAAEAPPLTFAAIIFMLTMMTTLLAVLMDFHTAILSPDDAEVVGVRPVTPRTYFLARYFNFLFYVAAIGSALCLGPALVVGLGGDPAFAAGILVAGVMSGFLCAALVVVFYALMIRFSDLERLKDLLVYVQVGMSLLLLATYHVAGRGIEVADSALETGPWLAAPPIWFASLATVIGGDPTGPRLVIAGATLAATLISIFVPVPIMSFRYSEYLGSLRSRRGTAGPGSTRRRGLISRLFFPGAQGAVLNLCRIQISRDRSLKMRALPMAVLSLVFLGWAWYRGELDNPFVEGGSSSFTYMVPLFILLAAVNFVFAMQTSEHHAAAWIFRAAPISSGADVVLAWHKVVLYRIAFPLLLIYTAVTAWVWKQPGEALLNAALYFLLVDAALSVSMILLAKDFPFARPLTRGEGMKFILPYMGVFLVFTGLVFIQMIACRVPAVLTGYIVALVLFAMGLRRLSSAIVGRRLGRVSLDAG